MSSYLSVFFSSTYAQQHLKVECDIKLDNTDDAVIGGGSTEYDIDSNNIRIDGRSEQWYLGVHNETASNTTDIFIGKSGKEDGTFHIDQSTDVGIGTSTPVDAILVYQMSHLASRRFVKNCI